MSVNDRVQGLACRIRLRASLAFGVNRTLSEKKLLWVGAKIRFYKRNHIFIKNLQVESFKRCTTQFSVLVCPRWKDSARYHNSYFQQQRMPLKPFTCKNYYLLRFYIPRSLSLKRHIQWKRIGSEFVIQVVFHISLEEDLCLGKVSLFCSVKAERILL